MLPEIKWLFFDLGSTLVDESQCLRERFNKIVELNGLDKTTFSDKVLEYAEENSYAIKQAAEFFGVDIPEWNKNLEQLYPNVHNVLSILFGKYKLGIIANQSSGTNDRLKAWGIFKYFDVIISSAEEGLEKPDLKIFELALNRAGCKPYEAVMIGDRLDNDILPANKMGMNTVWVRQSFAKYQQPKDIDETPNLTIASISDIINVM